MQPEILLSATSPRPPYPCFTLTYGIFLFLFENPENILAVLLERNGRLVALPASSLYVGTHREEKCFKHFVHSWPDKIASFVLFRMSTIYSTLFVFTCGLTVHIFDYIYYRQRRQEFTMNL